jgi:hypothetical protein
MIPTELDEYATSVMWGSPTKNYDWKMRLAAPARVVKIVDWRLSRFMMSRR